MSFENKHERKQKRREKFYKEVKEKKFKIQGNLGNKNQPYKRKDKYEYEADGLDFNF